MEIKLDQQYQYAATILAAVDDMFHNKECQYYLDLEDMMSDGEKVKAFLHALSTIVPNTIWNKITGQEKNNLEYNHLANSLCFEFSKREKESSDQE